MQANPNHQLAGNAQYWFAETFRIRQLYVDAASAYLEGYQKYPKSEKAPDNLLKLGVSLVQIGEKDQGCMMITSLEKEYPKASQSILQKAKYEEKKFECKKDNSSNLILDKYLKNKKIFKIYKDFEKNFKTINNPGKIAISVSGGPDSMALCFLVSCYAFKNNYKITSRFFLVDHGLRKIHLRKLELLKKN